MPFKMRSAGKETELTSANELIAQLKKDTKGNEELQVSRCQHETQVAASGTACRNKDEVGHQSLYQAV